MEHHYPIHISEFSTDSSEKSLSLAFTTYLMGSDCLAFYASHKDSSRSPNIYSCVFWIKQISNCLSLACTSYLSKESNYLADETFQQDNSGCPLTLHLFVVFWIKQFSNIFCNRLQWNTHNLQNFVCSALLFNRAAVAMSSSSGVRSAHTIF